MRSKDGTILCSENWILYGLFALAAMNFKAKFFYFVFAAVIIHFLLHKRIQIEKSAIWYVLFTIVYVAYASNIGLMDAIRKFAFIACYILGFNLLINASENEMDKQFLQEQWLERCITALSIGSWAHLMLNFSINQGSSGTRNTIDFWTGKPMAATGQTALAVLMLATGFVCVVLPMTKATRWFGIGAVSSIVIYNFTLGGRTILVLSALLMLIIIVFVVTSHQLTSCQKRKSIRLVLLLLLCIVLTFTFNVAGIRSKVMESNLSDRFQNAENAEDLLEDGRMENKIQYLRNMMNYPFGGLHMRERYGFAHDLLLDAYDECGIGILIALLGILVNSIIDLWKSVNSQYLTARLKCLVICTYVAIFLEFFMEPIFAGMPWLFACYALISGCVRGMVFTNE